VKYQDLGQKFLKIKILVKNQYFRQKSKISVKNQNFGQKSKLWIKIKILDKNQNFGQKSKSCKNRRHMLVPSSVYLNR